MGELAGIPHRKAIRAFERGGFKIIRQGKHIILSNGAQTIAVPGNNPIKSFTRVGIVKNAGLTVEQFRDLLISVCKPVARRKPMRHEFTAILERDEQWYIGFCPEVPGANGQGLTREDCLHNLAEAVALILEDRLEDGLRGVPADAIREVLTIS